MNLQKNESITWKLKGNEAYKRGLYDDAIRFYTNAIELDDTNAIFYSNRSLCYLCIRSYNDAVNDAIKCVEIDPLFIKGYLRWGAALQANEDELRVYDKGLAQENISKNDAGMLENARQKVLKKIITEQQQQQQQQSIGGTSSVASTTTNKKAVLRGVWATKQSSVSLQQATTTTKIESKSNVSRLLSHPNTSKSCWYHYNPRVTDGSSAPPKHANTNNTTIVVATVITTTSDDPKVLGIYEDDEWCIPSEVVNSSVFKCANDLLSSLNVTCETPLRVIAIEHYPSLKNDWFRIFLGANSVNQGVFSADHRLEWLNISQLPKQEKTSSLLLNYAEIASSLSAPSIPFVHQPRVGFHANMVEVCVCYKDTMLMIQQQDELCLPCTHVDVGEDVGFTASRLIRALFGLVIIVDGVKSIHHASTDSTHGLYGLKVCVGATVKSKLPDPTYTHTCAPSYQWIATTTTVDDDNDMVIPLIHIGHVHEK